MKCVVSVKKVILEDEVQHITIPPGQALLVYTVMPDCVTLLSLKEEETYVVDRDTFERCFKALGELKNVGGDKLTPNG